MRTAQVCCVKPQDDKLETLGEEACTEMSPNVAIRGKQYFIRVI